MEVWLEGGSYLGIFTGILLEGEAVFLSAIAVAQLGHLKWGWIIFTVFLAALTHDWTVFLISKKQGKSIIEKRPNWQQQSVKLQSWLGGNMTYLLLFYRFLIGMRIISLTLIGISEISIPRFAVFSLISTLLWVSIIGTLGYFFTDPLIAIYELIAENIVLFLLILVSIFGISWWRKRG